MASFDDQSTAREPRAGARVLHVGPLEAIRRHVLLAVVPLLLFAGGAVAYGLARTPQYTAEARLAIGRIDLNAPGALSSFAEATETISASYSRAISADQVIDRVSQELSLDPFTVRIRLGATPIPGSAVIRVLAVGPSDEYAIALANSGSAALLDYTKEINVRNPNADRLFREFKLAVTRASRRQEQVEALEILPSILVDKEDLASARTKAAAAGLRVETLRANYQATQESQSTVSLVQQLTTASVATNDRTEELQLVLFYALAAGGLIGAALATLRANGEARAAARS